MRNMASKGRMTVRQKTSWMLKSLMFPAFGAPFSRKYQTSSPTPTAKAPTGRDHQRRDALLRQRCSTRTMVAIAKKAHQADMRI